MPRRLRCVAHVLAGAFVLASMAFANSAYAKGFRVLYAFKGGTDGAFSQAPLVADGNGNFYGTTVHGGGSGCQGYGCGIAFRIASDDTETVLHRFAGGTDGALPETAGFLLGKDGNLYGTTGAGGGSGCPPYGGCGTIFRLTTDGIETILYSFTRFHNGVFPQGLIERGGTFFGTTAGGGDRDGDCQSGGLGCGTVFRLDRDLRKHVLYAFKGGYDGALPHLQPLEDREGNLYATTFEGGSGSNCVFSGCGTIVKVAPDGSETVLYAFRGGADGTAPESNLIVDADGNLYGTTEYGGTGCGSYGCGTAFRLAPDGTETVLYAFVGGADGSHPWGGVISDEQGNLYGITQEGGVGCASHGCGTIFRLAPDGTKTVLYAFQGTDDGALPQAALIASRKRLYGTTTRGGQGSCDFGLAIGCGTVFELSK